VRLEEGKHYRTRSGRKVKCIAVSTMDHGEKYGALCIVDNSTIGSVFTIDGRYNAGGTDDWDIIAEWKETKNVKMAPAVFKSFSGSLNISIDIHESEEQAKLRCPGFIKWLGCTPYEIEVEVEVE